MNKETYKIPSAAYAAWTVSKIRLKDGEFVGLGEQPSGGILFDGNQKPIGFRPYDGNIRDYDLDEVEAVKDSIDGEWYSLDEYLEGDFPTFLRRLR
jgi:hypothetical protein